jgi:hypothetical protein
MSAAAIGAVAAALALGATVLACTALGPLL